MAWLKRDRGSERTRSNSTPQPTRRSSPSPRVPKRQRIAKTDGASHGCGSKRCQPLGTTGGWVYFSILFLLPIGFFRYLVFLIHSHFFFKGRRHEMAGSGQGDWGGQKKKTPFWSGDVGVLVHFFLLGCLGTLFWGMPLACAEGNSLACAVGRSRCARQTRRARQARRAR